jgi:zinc protease
MRMNLRLPVLALAGALALAGSAAISQDRQGAPAQAPAAEPWPQQASDLAADPDVRFGTLPNGMRYAIRRNATPPGEASLRLRIDAGSLHEADDQRGLAHFLEHMVLNGTTNVPEGEFVRRLERHGLRFGPDTNASTDFRQTVFKLDLPETDAETVDTALFLLREVADEATLAAAAIESERGIIQSEERTRATPAYRIAIDELGYMMRGQRLPGRMPIGAAEVIASAPRERFTAFYNAYYRPERATLVAVGDFDVAQMEAKIRERFGSWRGQGPAGTDPDLGAVATRPLESRLMVEPGGPARVSLTWVRPPDPRPDTSARRIERLVDTLALEILNRRLERIAATQSPPPFVTASSARTELAESADITQLIAVAQPGEWRRALGVIETEQRKLVEHGVTAAELEREINRMRTGLNSQVAGAATRPSAALAEGLVGAVDRDNVYIAPAESLRLFERGVAGLTPDRVAQAARNIFAGDPILYSTAPAAIEGGEGAILAAYRQSRAAPVAANPAQQAQAWPYTSFGTPGRVAERSQIAAPIDATAVRFANGVRLTVKRTDFTDNQVLVSVRFGDGRLALPAQGANPNWALALGLQAGGLGRIGFEDMQEALNTRVYSAGLSIEEDSFALGGVTRPDDLAVQMQVLAAYVTDPAWRPTGWDRIRSLAGTIHAQLASTPAGVFGRDGELLLHDGDRRWATPTQEEMAASSIADARAVLDGPLVNAPIEIVIVGDVDVEEAIRQTAATFGALPPRSEAPAAEAAIRFPAATPEPVRLTHSGRADQGLAYIGWPTAGFFDDTRRARTLNLLSSVFQLRLVQKIREEQGTTYSPQASHEASEAYRGYGVFSGQIQARPEALAGFLRDAEAIAAELRDRPIEADELQRARRPLVESIQRQRASSNGWWLSNLPRVQTDPRVAAMIASQMADYEAMTPADLQRIARQYLVPGRAWKLLVVPEPGAPAS